MNTTNDAPIIENTTFYEKERVRFAQQPFGSDEERHDFEYSLDDWKSYCESNRTLRRSQYICKEYVSIQNAKDSAIWHTSIRRDDSKQIDVLVWEGKIESLEIDAIVNAANETLLGGGGVDQAIHEGSGPLLVKECANIIGGCEIGDAKLTKGYFLPSNYVIHTVGPILNPPDWSPDPIALTQCYESSLKICEEKKLVSVAFPCISCGFYGFPIPLSSNVVASFLKEKVRTLQHVETIILCVFTQDQKKYYTKAFSKEFESQLEVNV